MGAPKPPISLLGVYEINSARRFRRAYSFIFLSALASSLPSKPLLFIKATKSFSAGLPLTARLTTRLINAGLSDRYISTSNTARNSSSLPRTSRVTIALVHFQQREQFRNSGWALFSGGATQTSSISLASGRLHTRSIFSMRDKPAPADTKRVVSVDKRGSNIGSMKDIP